MGRRLIGGALVAIGLIAASLAWAGFAASRTVLDPARSEAIATDLYQDREVRNQLRSSMASALDAALPDGVQVSRTELVAAADRALDDPAVEALLVGGLIRSHQRFLGEDPNPDQPIVIDGAAMARASRAALINLRPELANSVPEPPSVPVELPTERLPDASGFRTWLNASVAMLASVAVGLVVAAFVLTNDRPRVLRRVGYWAIGASLFWIVVGFVLPELAHLLIPGAAAILAALWGVAAGGMLEPSRTALIAGVAAVVLSFVWAGIAALVGGGRSQPAGRRERVPDQRPRPSRPVPQAHRPAPRPTPAPAAAAPPRPVRTPGPATPPRGVPAVSPAATPPGVPASQTAPGVPASQTAPGVPAHKPAPAHAPASQPAPRWVEGVGYVDESGGPERDDTRPG
jgi:hypothetical protein